MKIEKEFSKKEVFSTVEKSLAGEEFQGVQ